MARHLHFRRAAEELHLAQPALSRQIQALERELGTALLDRDHRAVALTPAGHQLLEDAVPLLAAADAARRRVQRAGRGAHRLAVGFRAGIVVTAAVRAFTQVRPEATVDVVRLEWDEQEEAIRSGRVDLAYVRRPIVEDGLRLTPLWREPRLAALPSDHPLAGRASLTVADLAGERHLRYLEPTPGSTAADPRARLRTVEEKLEHVAGGHGIIVLPESATAYYRRPDVVYVPVVDAEPDEVLLAREARRRSRLLSDFEAAAFSVIAAPARADEAGAAAPASS